MTKQLARKFILGDLVKHTLTDMTYRIAWIDHNSLEAGIISQEAKYNAWEGKVVSLAELELVEPSVHVQRPLKPVSEMSEPEMREHIRLLREGRQEALQNYFSDVAKNYNKKSKSSTTTKPKRTVETLMDKYDLEDKDFAQYLLDNPKVLDLVESLGLDFVKQKYEEQKGEKE